MGDAKKLEINKERFIGKPLQVLLNEIVPKIKSAIGDPDNNSKEQAKTINLYFVDKKEFLSRDKKKENPTKIGVSLKRKLNKSILHYWVQIHGQKNKKNNTVI